MFLVLMDIFAWVFVIAIGVTALFLAFFGLLHVLMRFSLAFSLAMLAIYILAMVSQWPPWVAGAVLLFAAYGFLAFVVYVRYFRRSTRARRNSATILKTESPPNGAGAS